MNIKLDRKEYQINKSYTGEVEVRGKAFPYTLEVIDVLGSEESQDYYINWQHFPDNLDELEKGIIELYKEQETIA